MFELLKKGKYEVILEITFPRSFLNKKTVIVTKRNIYGFLEPWKPRNVDLPHSNSWKEEEKYHYRDFLFYR